MARQRMAIIGCGGMANAHARRFEAVRHRVDMVAAVDVDPARAQAVAERLGGNVRVATDYRDVLDDVDAVLLVLPHHLHHPIGMECLEQGKHVLMEKPLANTERECLDLIEASERRGRILMVAYCMRYHPLVARMKELIERKAYGECFQLSIWTEQHTERDPSNWMCRADQVGGGQLFSHGCHYIDILLWCLGEPVEGTHIGSNLCTPWMEREGTSNVTMRFVGGAMGYHFGTWGARGTRLGYAFHAHCNEGMLEFHRAGSRLIFHRGGKEEIVEESPEGGKYTELEMAHFLDCIETGRPPLTNARDSLQGLRVIWRLYDAETRHTLADLRGLRLGRP